jgi:uncharacterized protein YmfQ (DUF2313 family)
MALSSADYLSTLKALLPPGAAWQPAPGSNLEAQLAAWADEFARLDGRAEDLRRESDPLTAVDLLSDWERVLGLAGQTAGFSLLERQQTARRRLVENGDASLPAWIERAADLGHTVTLREPPAMVCGDSECGDELAPFEVRYVLEVTAPVVLTHPAKCGALVCGDNLGSYDTQRLEAEMNRVKPAHTVLQFIYA